MKKQVLKTIYMFVLATILFHIELPVCKIFLVLFSTIWLVVLLGYGSRNNKEFLTNAIVISIGAIFSYVVMKLINGGKISGIDKIEMGLSIICVSELSIASFFIFRKNKKEECVERSQIFESRKYDLDRIKHFIFRVPVLGINSNWGNGKSFVIERLCEEIEIQNCFETIQIDLLTCNLNEIEVILMSEIEKILDKYRIYSKNSRQIKKMLGEYGIIKQVTDFIMDNQMTFSAAFQGFKTDVNRIKKNILIIYEDLDRITDEGNIKKIFAISEKLASNKIHIIYQYEQNNLEQMGLNREYLEKYIPFVINLTEIDYKEIVKNLWNELQMDEIGIAQEEIKNIQYHIPQNLEIQKILNINVGIRILFCEISIRKVKIFMEEIKWLLTDNEYLFKKENQKTVIRFLFIKNFLYHYYEKFNFVDSVEETLLFEYGDRKYTMSQLLYKKETKDFSAEEIKEIFSIEKNKEIYAILMFLGCDFVWKNEEKEQESFLREEISNLKKRENIERINRIIWNILGNGKSEFTNIKSSIEKFKKGVLGVSEEEQKAAWEKYKKDLYYGNILKDNRTIFKYGDNYYTILFQGFSISENTEKDWIGLLRFLDKMEENKIITIDLIKCLNYCDLTKKKVFIEAITIFCNYTIVGNANQEECYKRFLKNYLEAIFYFGYSTSHIFMPWNLDASLNAKDFIEMIKQQLDSIEEKIEQEKENLVILEAKRECDLIKSFIQKNHRMILTKEKVMPNQIQTHISSKSVRKNQEEFDRLTCYIKENMSIQEQKIFMDEVEESYKNSKIYPDDLQDLMKKYKGLNK